MSRRRTDDLVIAAQPRHLLPAPNAPFILLRHPDGDQLVAPFAKRTRGPSFDEVRLVTNLARRLANEARNLPCGCFWIDRDGQRRSVSRSFADG